MKRNTPDEWNTQVMRDKLQSRIPPSVLMERAPQQSLPGYLNQLMGRRSIATDTIAELAALNRASLYKILNGSTRQPQRNVLLRLALVLRADFSETQELLKRGGRAALSGNRGRDIIISDGIINGKDIEEVNRRLTEYHFPDLYSKE